MKTPGLAVRGKKNATDPLFQSLAIEVRVVVCLQLTVSGLLPLRPPPGIPGGQSIEVSSF